MPDEDDYFRKLDLEAKAKMRARLEAQNADAARLARAELHHLKCGKCGADMRTEAFRGIEIERCTECGSVLLDPGELEQLAGNDQTETFTSFLSMFGNKRR